MVVAANLLEGNRDRPDYHGVPSVAFSLPPFAAVGLAEAEARAAGRRFCVRHAKTSDWYIARRVAEAVYGFNTLMGGSGRILGAHIVGAHSDEVINLFALAIRDGLVVENLKQTIFRLTIGTSDIDYML
jgi:glutathione reductase (NADPH)